MILIANIWFLGFVLKLLPRTFVFRHMTDYVLQRNFGVLGLYQMECTAKYPMTCPTSARMKLMTMPLTKFRNQTIEMIIYPCPAMVVTNMLAMIFLTMKREKSTNRCKATEAHLQRDSILMKATVTTNVQEMEALARASLTWRKHQSLQLVMHFTSTKALSHRNNGKLTEQ